MFLIQLAASSGPPALPLGGLIGRILLAALLGGMVGFEREFRDQPAGFRTHILVSLGAALFTMAGAYGVSSFVGARGVSFDPTRIAAQVVTGIGFLGAGAILRYGVTVRGLTTAAALWVTAAIGVAVGLGYYWGGVVTSLATVAALVGLKQVETTVVHRIRRGRHDFVIDLGPELRIDELASIVDSHQGEIVSMKVASTPDAQRQLNLTLVVPTGVDARSLATEMRALKGVTTLEWN
ncbi:MAG: putative Mg2+ transporter-C (MgtC) family protein [Actinomycetota bacterium]|jgi:putative Mg2+ transporter-C (MgtC) family protein|nr:putative Mg2+ transporter-C (MgtC) family protein [Actinomycetota bacterium]